MEKAPSKANAKRQFILLYLVSLALIFIVVSAFWKVSSTETADAVVTTNDDASSFMQIDTLLHAKIDALDAGIARYSTSKNANELTTVQRAMYSLQTTIDSVDKQAAILLDGSRKQHMQLAVANFRKLVAEKRQLLAGGGSVKLSNVAIAGAADSGRQINRARSEEVNQLKLQLGQKEERIRALEQLTSANGQDKDKLIVTLQNQLKQKEAALQQRMNTSVQVPRSSDTEWQSKYTALKSSYDKASANEKALKVALKTAAEDNRRLLSQLQLMRSEKKN
ncbi:MAG TPA: hypothetical protein VMR70_07605 [Flavisolibacter sp.]|nr:hypothetical protein [Flavisolibacter sp.]